MADPRRSPFALPRVDRVAGRPELAEARERLGPKAVVDIVRAVIDGARSARRQGLGSVLDEDAAAAAASERARAVLATRIRRVINATGVILHTNLGRAPLGAAAARATAELAGGYGSLEIDLATGKRGGRGRFVETALETLTRAEAAVVVNNCAAAVLLLLAGVARGRPVIVSRGELVEIGGGFRVPDVMAESGARLVEVGTTNKTRVGDYERALDAHPDAAAILRVHPSNFVQVGFVERPSLAELVALGDARSIPVLEDLGGGALVDFRAAGLAGEPTVQASIEAGVSAVSFSGDKALGGPQAGVIAGRRAVIDRLRKHPLHRALRLGRLPMVALEATISAYLEGRAQQEIPVLARAHAPIEQLVGRAEGWARALRGHGIAATVVSTEAELGGGALPGQTLPSAALRLDPAVAPDVLAALLRCGQPAVVGRIRDGAVLFDARTVLEGEDEPLLQAITAAVAAASAAG